MEAAVAVYHREDLAADRNALGVGVQQGQKNADPDNRLGTDAEFRRWWRILDETDPPIGGRDDSAGAVWWSAGRMPEERRVSAGRRQSCPARPAVVAAEGGHDEPGGDKRKASRVHRRDRASQHAHQSLRT